MPQVTMPQLGEGVEQGTIGKWLKAVGDHVRIGDPLVEVVTDKVNAEVPSPFEGTLTSILVAEGETIANDVAIAEVEIAGAPRPSRGRSRSRRPPRPRRPLRSPPAAPAAAGRSDRARPPAAAPPPPAGAAPGAAASPARCRGRRSRRRSMSQPASA